MADDPSVSVTCGWCKLHYPKRPASGLCNNCGGPLPHPPGPDRGPTPPPAPRVIPARYRRSILWTRNVVALLGLIFFCLGVPFLGAGVVILSTVRSWQAFLAFPIVGGVFSALGLPMLLVGRRVGKRKLMALEHGTAAPGEITNVQLNTRVMINGRNPWLLTYSFSAGQEPCDGTAQSFSPHEGGRKAGDPVWVVFAPDDPSISTLWPPVS